jgi:TolB-like protein
MMHGRAPPEATGEPQGHAVGSSIDGETNSAAGGAAIGLGREAVLSQLEMLHAHAFGGSFKLFAFLRFVVSEALEGRAYSLKEMVIGAELYGGAETYDPRIDSTVRVEARRLRKKLSHYYATIGQMDEIVITIPTGGYSPHFERRQVAVRDRRPPDLHPRPGEEGSESPVLAVLPFTALAATDAEIGFANGVTDEIIFAAKGVLACGLTSRALVFQYRNQGFSIPELVTRTRAGLILHGTIRRADGRRRIAMELMNSTGRIVWSDRVDVDGDTDIPSQERAAAAILQRLLSGMSHLSVKS